MFKKLFGENSINVKSAKEMAGKLLRIMDENTNQHVIELDRFVNCNNMNVQMYIRKEDNGMVYKVYPVIPESRIVKHDSKDYKYYKTAIINEKVTYDRSTYEGVEQEVKLVEQLCLNSINSKLKEKGNNIILKFGKSKFTLCKNKLKLVEDINDNIVAKMPWA